MPRSLQLRTDFPGVVELSVINQGIFFLSVFQGHGLLTALGINNGQSGMKQGALPCLKKSLSIRPPALHGIEHFPKDLLGNRQMNTACNGTHWFTTSFRLNIICLSGF